MSEDAEFRDAQAVTHRTRQEPEAGTQAGPGGSCSSYRSFRRAELSFRTRGFSLTKTFP